jgi:hypothetical protein
MKEKLEICKMVIIETSDGKEIKITPKSINLLNVNSDLHENFTALIIKE